MHAAAAVGLRLACRSLSCASAPVAGLQVSGGFDEVLIVWDVRNARPVKIIPGHCDPVSGPLC